MWCVGGEVMCGEVMCGVVVCGVCVAADLRERERGLGASLGVMLGNRVRALQ